MSHTISIDVSSEQLAGISTTLEEGLGNFAIAAEKLQTISKSAKDELNVTDDIAKVKIAIGALSQAITAATTAEKVGIAVALNEIGVALSGIATHIKTIDPSKSIQAEIGSVVSKFAASLQAALVLPTSPNPTKASAASRATDINIETIDITGRVSDAILSKHFNVSQIDLTEKVAKAVQAAKIATGEYDLTERIGAIVGKTNFTIDEIDITSAVKKATDAIGYQIDRVDLTKKIEAAIGADRFILSDIDLTAKIDNAIGTDTFKTETIDITAAVAASVQRLDFKTDATTDKRTTATQPKPEFVSSTIDLTPFVAQKIDSGVFTIGKIDLTPIVAQKIAADIFTVSPQDLTDRIAASIDDRTFNVGTIDLTARVDAQIESKDFTVKPIDLSSKIAKAVSNETFSVQGVDLSSRIDSGIEQTTISIGTIDLTDKLKESIQKLVLTVQPIDLTKAIAAKIGIDSFTVSPIDLTARIAQAINNTSFAVSPIDLTTEIASAVAKQAYTTTAINITDRVAASIDNRTFKVDAVDLTAKIDNAIDGETFKIAPIDVTKKVTSAIDKNTFSADKTDLTADVSASINSDKFTVDTIDLTAKIAAILGDRIFSIDRIDLTELVSSAVGSPFDVKDTIELTAKIVEAVNKTVFKSSSIDLTTRLQMAIDSATIETAKLTTNAAKAQDVEIAAIEISSSDILRKLTFEPIDIPSRDISDKITIGEIDSIALSSSDLLSKISIATVNITELVAEAIGTVDMTDVLDRSVKQTDIAAPAVNSPNDALQGVLNVFENFTAEAETEALAAGEQIKNLDKMRATLVKIDKKFAELYTTQTATVDLFKNIVSSIETISAKFNQLAQSIESGDTNPESAVPAAESIVNENLQQRRFSSTASDFALNNTAAEGAVDFARDLGDPTTIAATEKSRDDKIKERAAELAAQGKELANGTPDADSLNAYADAILYFQEIVKSQSKEVRAAVAESLNLVKTGKDNLGAGKNFAAVSYFSKAKGEIGSIAGLGDALKARSAAGDYQNIGQIGNLQGNTAKGMGRIGVAPDGASKALRDLLRSALQSSMTGDISATDLVSSIKAKVKLAESTLTELDRKLVEDHFKAFAAKAKTIDRQPSKTPTIDKLGDDARQVADNLSNTVVAMYAAMGETTRRTGDRLRNAVKRTKDLGAKAAARASADIERVVDAKDKIVDTASNLTDRAKADTKKVKNTIDRGREIVDAIPQVPSAIADRAKAARDSVVSNVAEGGAAVMSNITDRAKADTDKLKNANADTLRRGRDAVKAVGDGLSSIGSLGEKIWGIGQTISDKADAFTAAGRRRKRSRQEQRDNYDIDFDNRGSGGSKPPKPPKSIDRGDAPGEDGRPNSRYRYAAGIARNNSNVARTTDMAAVGREASNQLERSDFDVLSKGVYIRLLKFNLDKLVNGSKREQKEAKAYIDNVRRTIEDLPDATRIETRKILNNKDRRESAAAERDDAKSKRDNRADKSKIAKDAKSVYTQELEAYRQSVILGIPKDMGDLVRAAKNLATPDERSKAKTTILRLKKQRTEAQQDRVAKNKEADAKKLADAAKEQEELERDRQAGINQRDTARYARAVSALSNVLASIEAKVYGSIDDAEIALNEAAKNVRVSASVLDPKTQRSARKIINKSLKDGFKDIRPAIEPIENEDINKLKSATQNVKSDNYSYEQKQFKDAVKKYNLKLISYQELRDLYSRLPEILIRDNMLDMVAIAKKDAAQNLKANKTKPVKDRSSAEILGRIQIASVMGAAGNFDSYNAIVADVKERFPNDQKVVRAAYGLSQQRRKYAVKNTSTDDLRAIDNADEIVIKELDRRYQAMVATYSRKLSFAIKKANVENVKTSVTPDNRIPQAYFEATELKEIDYKRSQVKVDERASKSKAIELRDTGTPEALTELEEGFRQKLYGYASAFKQLSKTLSAKTVNVEFEAEIQNLKNQFQLTGIRPDFNKAALLFKTKLERQKLEILAKTFDDKIENNKAIAFNKTLKSAKTEFASEKTISTATLGKLNAAAITIDQKREFDLFQRYMAEQIQRNITSALTSARSAVNRLIRAGDFDGAKSAIDASGFTNELQDLQKSIVAKQQKAIIDRLKTTIASARNDFDPVYSRVAVSTDDIRSDNPQIAELDEQGTSTTNTLIAAYESWVKNQIDAYDKAEYTVALDLAKSGDTTDLAAIAASQSTKTKEAQRALAKLTSEFQQMSEEERAHVAAARAKMNAARSDQSDDRNDLIRAAMVTPPQMVPGRTTQAYQDNIRYINNQGQKILKQSEDGTATSDKINIQDLSGLYYTLKSITANVIDSLARINEAATATEKTMRKLSIVNNNDVGRSRLDVESGKSLAAKYGNSERSYIDSIARYKASVPTEYDKFGTQLPSKVSDDGLRTIVEGLASASVVNQLSADKMNDASTAIEQMFSKGTVQAEELIRQLANALPGVLSQFAQSQGIDTRELKRRMSQGEVSIETLEKFGEFQKRIYGKQAESGSLTKELNTLSGNTEDIRNSAGAASALSLEVGLSIVNTIVAGLKTNAMTFAIALSPAFGYLMGMVAKVFIASTLNNDIVKPRVEAVKAVAQKNIAPVGMLAAGLAVSAIGAKFAGEQSLDDALSKFTKNLSYAAEGLGALFSGISPKAATEKTNGTNSTIAGATLIGMAGISALRKNTNYLDGLNGLDREITTRSNALSNSIKSGVSQIFPKGIDPIGNNNGRTPNRAFGSVAIAAEERYLLNRIEERRQARITNNRVEGRSFGSIASNRELTTPRSIVERGREFVQGNVQRVNNFIQGDNRVSNRAFGSINQAEVDKIANNRKAFAQATGDLVTSFGLSMVALAFANTEFVSEYAKQTKETMKALEAARLAAFPNANGAANGADRLTVKEVKAKEDLGFSFDSLIGRLNDDFSLDFKSKSTARLEELSKRGFKGAQTEIEQRQLGKSGREGGLQTYSGNADAESVETTFESQEKTRKILTEIDNDASFAADIAAANKQKAKIAQLKKLKKEALESGATDDEKVRIDSQTIIAEREYTKISKPILERKNVAIAAVKGIDTDRSNYLSSSEFKRDSATVQRQKLAEFDRLRAEAQQYVESIAKKIEQFDIAGMVSIVTKEFETQSKKLDRELSRVQTDTSRMERTSTKLRQDEGDDLRSGSRRADVAAYAADKNVDLSKRKLELAKKYEEAIEMLPSSADQEAKLQSAIDARIAAEKDYATSLSNQEQARFDKQNVKEQRIQTEFDNKQSYVNNAASRRETQIRTSAEVSLDVRKQPEIDAEISNKIETAAVEKTKQTYESLKKIAKSIKVNKTAFDQKLDAARTEYENTVANLNLAKKTRAKEAQQRLESNSITDLGRSFDRQTTRLEERKVLREPLPALTNNIAYDRNRADVSTKNAIDDLQTAKSKTAEFATMLAKIKSPDLKIEKTIEYERMVSDIKKRSFDAEVARLNALKVRLDQLKAFTDSLSGITSAKLTNSATALSTLNQYQQRDAGFKATNTEGKSDDILQAQAKLAAAQRSQTDTQIRFNDAKKAIGASIDTAAEVGKAQGLPFDSESLKTTIGQIGSMMIGDGKSNRGVMAYDAENFINELRSGLDTAMQTRQGEEDVSVTAKLGKTDVPITGSPELLRQLIDNLNKFVPIVASKNQAENDKTIATNELKVARQQAAKELLEAKQTKNNNDTAYKNEIAAIETDIRNAAKKFDNDVKILGSTAADAPTRASAESIVNKIDDESKERVAGGATTSRRDVLERQIDNLINSSAVSRTQGSPERREIAEVNLQIAIKGLTDSYNKNNLGNDKSIAESIYAMGSDYMRTAALARQTYTTLSDSLLSLQRAGTDLLSSYGVQRDKAYSVTSSRDKDDRYKIDVQTYDPNDRGATAMYDAIGKMDTYREQVREFQKSLDYGKPTDAKAALDSLKSKVDNGEIKSPVVAEAVKKALGGIDIANISNKDAMAVFEQLGAMAQKLEITNAQYQKVVDNAVQLVKLTDTADIAESNVSTLEGRGRDRQRSYRRGTIETIASGRETDDETTNIYNNRLAALRARTESAIIAAGGNNTLRGKIEQQKGFNAERDLQSEYADLPLYGRQFSADIRDAVSSSTKFSSIFRDAIEKGDWSDVFGSTMRGILNKLSDTYSDRASKQLGDMVGGYVESFFGSAAALTGKIETAQPEPLVLRSLFQDEPFDVATLFTNSSGAAEGGEVDFSDIDDIGETIASGIGSTLKNGITKSLGSTGFGGLFGAVGGLLGFADGKLTTQGFASGKMGSEYPKTQNQAPSEPYGSRLAVINERELVLPAGMAQEYLDYRKAVSSGSTNIANSNSQSTVINNYNTSNYRSGTASTFGESDQSRRDSTKSRFDRR